LVSDPKEAEKDDSYINEIAQEPQIATYSKSGKPNATSSRRAFAAATPGSYWGTTAKAKGTFIPENRKLQNCYNFDWVALEKCILSSHTARVIPERFFPLRLTVDGLGHAISTAP